MRSGRNARRERPRIGACRPDRASAGSRTGGVGGPFIRHDPRRRPTPGRTLCPGDHPPFQHRLGLPGLPRSAWHPRPYTDGLVETPDLHQARPRTVRGRQPPDPWRYSPAFRLSRAHRPLLRAGAGALGGSAGSVTGPGGGGDVAAAVEPGADRPAVVDDDVVGFVVVVDVGEQDKVQVGAGYSWCVPSSASPTRAAGGCPVCEC